ncbi:LysR substrate-binding domain-containing protein [Streptomyces sp. NPDC056549]|uniref:LysR substrate-binding domain-containing protein n=1 Tax=Streptomyces sp. NPDC056549 TaxID=3345864 RepID=UPI0036C89B02
MRDWTIRSTAGVERPRPVISPSSRANHSVGRANASVPIRTRCISRWTGPPATCRILGRCHGSRLLRGPVDVPGLATVELVAEPRVAALPADSPLAARTSLTLADLAPETAILNPVSGITTLGLWPPDDRPTATLTVGNTDDWLTAIAAGRAIGVSAASTAEMHPHPGVVYQHLADAPPVPVVFAWRDAAPRPAIGLLVDLARDLTAEG